MIDFSINRVDSNHVLTHARGLLRLDSTIVVLPLVQGCQRASDDGHSDFLRA